MRKTYTSTYYPEANASCERAFATLHLGLYGIAKRNKRDWCTFLPCVNAAINAAYNEAVGESPHKLVYGWDFVAPLIVSLGIPPPKLPTEQEEYKEEFLTRVKAIRENSEEFGIRYQQRSKAYWDKKAKPHNFKEGDLVYLKIPRGKFGYE